MNICISVEINFKLEEETIKEELANKLKSSKVAQAKDEMDDDEDDGCDVVWWCQDVMLCCDVLL